MISLTYEKNESHLQARRLSYVPKKEFITDIRNSIETMFIKYRRVKDHCQYF